MWKKVSPKSKNKIEETFKLLFIHSQINNFKQSEMYPDMNKTFPIINKRYISHPELPVQNNRKFNLKKYNRIYQI